MSRTPLPACRRKSAPLWYILFTLAAMNDPLRTELKFRENTVNHSQKLNTFCKSEIVRENRRCLNGSWENYLSSPQILQEPMASSLTLAKERNPGCRPFKRTS